MRLDPDFVTQSLNGTTIMIGTGSSDFHGIVKGNRTAGYVIELLKTETTRNEMIEKMLEHYDADRDIIEKDVDKVLDTLRQLDALIE